MKLKEAAKAELLRGLKDGTIKIKIVTTCGHCLQEFDSEVEFEAHLEDSRDYFKRVHGIEMDPARKSVKICPLPHPDSWAAKQAQKKKK